LRSQVWQAQLLSCQGLAPGQTATVTCDVPAPGVQIRIDAVTYYFGATSAILPSSVVLVSNPRGEALPTTLAYDSGITGSENPIYIRLDGRVALPYLEGPDPDAYAFAVVNTSEAATNVDIYVSGIILPGPQAPVCTPTFS